MASPLAEAESKVETRCLNSLLTPGVFDVAGKISSPPPQVIHKARQE